MKNAIGCFASLAYFAFLGMLMLGNMMGDCFPELGHSCPTDRERNIAIATMFLGGLALYAVVAFVVVRFGKRREDN